METGEMINTDTIQLEMEQEEWLNKMVDTNGETNAYQELIVNNGEKIEPLMAQMEQWSILDNVLNYIQHDRHHTMNHTLNIRTMNKHRSNPEAKEKKEFMEVDFGSMPHKLHEKYLDVYEAIQSKIVNTTRFDENSDLSTIYLGRSNKAKDDKLKAEESFPISELGYTLGKLLDGTECQLLLDTSATKSFISTSVYMRCKSLHSLPKFASKTQRIQVGNGQCVSVLFITPVIIDVHRHRFEIYTLVSEIHKNVDLVLGIKNVFELEGVINLSCCCLNRADM